MDTGNIRKLPEFDDHRVVSVVFDEKSGLEGYIAIHNNNLGPAVGGTRMFAYARKRDGLRDVLRLSRAMSYKCALAGVKYGGGKAVIIGDPKKLKSKKLLKAYAQNIGKLGGAFYTGEDVGISEEDVQYMLTVAPYFIGKSGVAGDPSPYAAMSTYVAMKAVVTKVLGKNSTKGLKVGVKGVGKVGSTLVEMLIRDKAELYIADIDRKAVSRIRSRFSNVKVVNHEDIIGLKLDVFAPCAMGNEVNESTIDSIGANVICGGANNQLANEKMGDELYKRGICYVPDYVSNAGGLIDVVDELEDGGYTKSRVIKRINNIENTVLNIMNSSRSRNLSTNRVADEMAEKIFLKN